MTLGAVGLLIGLRQLAGRQAVSGLAAVALKAFLLALLAGAAGWWVSGVFMGLWPGIVGTFVAAAIAALASAVIMSPLLIPKLRKRKRDRAAGKGSSDFLDGANSGNQSEE